MSTHFTHQQGQYLCVDAAPDPALGFAATPTGLLLYPVEAECGPLPCPPYVQDRELACAVCSR
jgi:hypothetical protein